MQSLNRLTRYVAITLISLMISTLGIQTNYLNSIAQYNVTVGTVANATNSTNFNKLYWGSVIILRNAHSNKLLNIAEGPLGPNVVWSPETATQNHDNTIVVLKKEGTNIVQFMNRYTRKLLGVNKSGQSETKLEVQTPTFYFDQYQSFYVDYLPNGNVFLTSVAFPSKIITLPFGGTNHAFRNFILYDKEGVDKALQSQFIVDQQGDGANANFGEGIQAEQVQPVTKQPTQTVTNQIDKLRTGAVVVLRNADLNQAVNIRNLPNGSKVNGSPANAPVDDEMILVAVQKPNSNIFQFFNRKNGKVLSVSTKGQVGDWAEVWNRVPGFNPYQSFYIDTLPNGNMVLCPVAFPSLALNLPEGGRSTTYQHYTLWSKEDIGNGLNRQFRVDVLDYGANVTIPPTPLSNQTVSSSNVPLKNTANIILQGFDLDRGLQKTSVGIQKSIPYIGIPSFDLVNLGKDKELYNGWDEGGHTIVSQTYWGYYIYNDKRGTINMIRDLEMMQNYFAFGSTAGASYLLKDGVKDTFKAGLLKVFKANPVVTQIEFAMMTYTTLFVPEAISQANKCLNTNEQSYLKLTLPGYLSVSCN
jgi:hypothetical protein